MEDNISRRQAIKSTGTVIAALGLAGCTGEAEESGDTASGSNDQATDNPTDEPTDSPTPNQKKVEILEHSTYEKEFESGVKGVVKNTSGKEQGYVEVRVKFYDSEGVRIGENFTNFSDMDAGMKAKFELMFLEDGSFDSYELEATTSAM